MTEPTDDELDAVIAEYRTRIYPQDMHPRFERAIMRAALAKWGAPPAVAGEPVGWEYRWKDTSPFSATSGQWSEWRRVEARSRLSTVEDAVREFQQYIADGLHYELRSLYTTPQPTQAQAGAVPMSHEAAKALVRKYGNDPLHLVLQVERHHGITGGQHGVE